MNWPPMTYFHWPLVFWPIGCSSSTWALLLPQCFLSGSASSWGLVEGALSQTSASCSDFLTWPPSHLEHFYRLICAVPTACITTCNMFWLTDWMYAAQGQGFHLSSPLPKHSVSNKAWYKGDTQRKRLSNKSFFSIVKIIGVYNRKLGDNGIKNEHFGILSSHLFPTCIFTLTLLGTTNLYPTFLT